MVKYDFINCDSLSKPIEKLPEYWEKSSCSPCSQGHFIARTSLRASWNAAAQPQAWVTSIARHRSSWLYSSETPKEVQLAIFGLPDCSVVSKWVPEMHLTHLSAAFRFLGVYIYLLSYRDNICQNLIKGKNLTIIFTGQQTSCCHLPPAASKHQIWLLI